jgi:hypothetical protein
MIISPADFVLAVAAGLIEYKVHGVSINGIFTGEFSPTLAGRPVTIRTTGDSNGVTTEMQGGRLAA